MEIETLIIVLCTLCFTGIAVVAFTAVFLLDVIVKLQLELAASKSVIACYRQIAGESESC